VRDAVDAVAMGRVKYSGVEASQGPPGHWDARLSANGLASLTDCLNYLVQWFKILGKNVFILDYRVRILDVTLRQTSQRLEFTHWEFTIIHRRSDKVTDTANFFQIIILFNHQSHRLLYKASSTA
jgi:hypothetical protein